MSASRLNLRRRHSGSDKVFVASVSKITTFNKTVLDNKWTSMQSIGEQIMITGSYADISKKLKLNKFLS